MVSPRIAFGDRPTAATAAQSIGSIGKRIGALAGLERLAHVGLGGGAAARWLEQSTAAARWITESTARLRRLSEAVGAAGAAAALPPAPRPAAQGQEVARLRREVATLRREVRRLRAQVGEHRPAE